MYKENLTGKDSGYFHCPYCEIKEDAKIKTVYEALKPIDGNCNNCGAWIDRGQYSVKVNGYFDIYKGAIKLLDEIVAQFNKILEYCDIDLSDHFDDDKITISLNTSDIIDKLFLGYHGGTTKRNFANAIGIKEDEHTWTISKNEDEEY